LGADLIRVLWLFKSGDLSALTSLATFAVDFLHSRALLPFVSKNPVFLGSRQ